MNLLAEAVLILPNLKRPPIYSRKNPGRSEPENRLISRRFELKLGRITTLFGARNEWLCGAAGQIPPSLVGIRRGLLDRGATEEMEFSGMRSFQNIVVGASHLSSNPGNFVEVRGWKTFVTREKGRVADSSTD
jgi:hypothetical protein